MANSAGGARALERSLGRAGGVRAQPSSPEYVLVVRPLKGGTKLSRSICKILLDEGCAAPARLGQGPFQSTGAPRGVGHGCP